jgi:hypothetical protein
MDVTLGVTQRIRGWELVGRGSGCVFWPQSTVNRTLEKPHLRLLEF